MKIRTDFVTNSSSSSFILAFENKNKVLESLRAENTGGRLETLIEDILDREENVKTKDEIIKEYKESIYYHVKWAIEEEIEREVGWKNAREWMNAHPKETEDRINKRINEKVDKLKNSLSDKEYIVSVTYSDDIDGDLEHDIVPYLKSCMACISHH